METKNGKRELLLLAIGVITVFALIIIWNGITPFLIDNDNIYLKTVASGEMTGKPEAHMYYMGILSGYVLKALYGMTGNMIPWFGVFLCVSMGVIMVLLLERSMKACSKTLTMAMTWGMFVLVFCCFFYHYFAKTQYTIATGIVGTAALFELALLPIREDAKKMFFQAIPFLFLSCWSFGMRDKGFLMLFPFFGMVFLGKFLDGRNQKSRVINVFALGIAFLLALAIPFGLNKLAYHSEEWKEFERYTDASEILFDYDGFPDFDTHEELYSQMGITRSSFEALTKHYNLLMDPAINADNMVLLAQVAKKERIANGPSVFQKAVGVLWAIVIRNLADYQDRPLNILVFLLYLFVLVMGVLSKKLPAIRDMVFLIVARMFDWIYLVWHGRYPFRVTQIIYMAELVLLVAIILNHKLWEAKKTFVILCALIVLTGIRFGYPVMKGTYGSVKGFREMSVCFTELEDYLSKKPENFYYFDMSHLYYMEDTLAFRPSDYENYVYMGSWMPNSPWYRHKMEGYGIDPDNVAGELLTNPHVYLLYQKVDFDDRTFLDAYFMDHMPGTELVVEDVFSSSNGFQYEILKLREMSPDT